jgi:hypothetical protein
MNFTKKNKKDIKSSSTFQKNKYELVALRIKNKYYEKSDVLEKVINEIVKKEIIHNT